MQYPNSHNNIHACEKALEGLKAFINENPEWCVEISNHRTNNFTSFSVAFSTSGFRISYVFEGYGEYVLQTQRIQENPDNAMIKMDGTEKHGYEALYMMSQIAYQLFLPLAHESTPGDVERERQYLEKLKSVAEKSSNRCQYWYQKQQI